MTGRYRRFERQGLVFVFKVDPADATLLHIFARHLKAPDDAIGVWFEGRRGRVPIICNPALERFETYHAGVGLYWFWVVEDRVVMVISCFDVWEEV